MVWDLLILGAGPAGCAAALQARRDGLAVLVVEARDADLPAPGETLHPGAEAVFERLGVSDAVLGAGFHRHRGVWVVWERSSPRVFQPYGSDAAGPWLGFQADRRRLNSILLAAARESGAVVRRGCAPGAPILRGGRVVGVVLGGEDVEARWTVDATGRRGWLACALRLATLRRSPAMRARYGWDGGDAPGSGQDPELAATSTGWRWRAPLGGARSAWVELAVAALADGARSRPGIDVSWRIAERCAGPGFLLAGDAAAVLDPSSSHGVLRALLGGLFAASLAGASAAGRMPDGAVVEAHADWTRRWFDADVEAMRALYRRHACGAVAALFA